MERCHYFEVNNRPVKMDLQLVRQSFHLVLVEIFMRFTIKYR